MKLLITTGGLGEDADLDAIEVQTFADQDKIAARIARAVRNWIRVVPVRNSGSRLDLRVTAEWVEGTDSRLPIQPEAAPTQRSSKRKRKVRK